MNYPLQLRFKVLALASQLSVYDHRGAPIAYVRQKIMRFREHAEVFESKKKNSLVAHIKADKIIDWSARYHFSDHAGNPVGSVGRKGMRSLWKATYHCFAADGVTPTFLIEEENPFAKFIDSIIGEIPLIGFISALLFHPKYVAKRASDQEVVMRLTKKAAFFEGRFQMDKLAPCKEAEELSLMLSYMMVALLERQRG